MRTTSRLSDANSLTDEERLVGIRKRTIWQEVIDAIYGYDYFISYRWSDGRQYALQLAESLQGVGYNVFLDSEDYKPGENWRWGGQYALKHTSRLVFLATKDAVCDPQKREAHKDPIVNELEAFEKGGRQKVRVLLDPIDDANWQESPLAAFFRGEDLHLTDLDRSGVQVIQELDRWASIDKRERKRTRLFQGIAAILFVLLIVAVVFGILARSQANRLRVVAVEGSIRGGYENLTKNDAAAAAADFSSALEIAPKNQIAADRLYSLLAYGTSQWVLQQRVDIDSGSVDFGLSNDWMEFSDLGLNPTSVEVDDEPDNSEAITTSRFESPDGAWGVVLNHYGGNFQAVQLPYYEIQLSDRSSYSFEETREVRGLAFDQTSTLVAVSLNTDQIYVFDREGTVAEFECNGIESISFVGKRWLVCRTASSEIRFVDLIEDDYVPIPFTGSQAIACKRNDRHWFVATREKDTYSIWSHPVSFQTMAKVSEAETTGPRNWEERTKFAPARGLELQGTDGEWLVVGNAASKSGWNKLTHMLSDDDARQKAMQDEDFSATIALVTTDAAISLDGQVIATSAGRTNPRIWREGEDKWETELEIDTDRYVRAVKLDETGRLAFVLYAEEGPAKPTKFDLFAVDTGERVATDFFARTDELLDISQDCEKTVVRVGGTIAVRSSRSTAELMSIPAANSAVLSYDGTRLATCTSSGVVCVIDLESGYTVSESLTFPVNSGSAKFREPHFSRNGVFVEIHRYGTPGQRCSWRVGTVLSRREAIQLVSVARQYFGIDVDQRKLAVEVLHDFSSQENSVVSELAMFLFAVETP
ncbi:MAG: toll/interleukin-1 receptor domain-containing protein [Planctomycetaceae bacterium]|nr:toll/interleukin-1 receptor domain-containing protein [Planctomycetaceae bacterium]MCB9951668.1 toll/interleukin-1 receptor domain-containing protein [Planctomycetaceae bacterium]